MEPKNAYDAVFAIRLLLKRVDLSVGVIKIAGASRDSLPL
jgi:hypothetical protein